MTSPDKRDVLCPPCRYSDCEEAGECMARIMAGTHAAPQVPGDREASGNLPIVSSPAAAAPVYSGDEQSTPRADDYHERILPSEITKHPIREFARAMEFARQLERELAEMERACKVLMESSAENLRLAHSSTERMPMTSARMRPASWFKGDVNVVEASFAHELEFCMEAALKEVEDLKPVPSSTERGTPCEHCKTPDDCKEVGCVRRALPEGVKGS